VEGAVAYGVDATDLRATLEAAGGGCGSGPPEAGPAGAGFDAVVFNFPFADLPAGGGGGGGAGGGGGGGGGEDFDSHWLAVERHRALAARFLRSARDVLRQPVPGGDPLSPAMGRAGGGVVVITVLLSQARECCLPCLCSRHGGSAPAAQCTGTRPLRFRI
jgi:hypothetical protein